MIDGAAMLVGIRLAISDYPIIGRILFPDTRKNRLEIAKRNLAIPTVVAAIPVDSRGIVDCVTDPTTVFCRVMTFALDEKLHLAYRGISHRIKTNGPVKMARIRGASSTFPFCLVCTACGMNANVRIGEEYQPIDMEDLVSNTWCKRCWPKDFLEDLDEWRNTRHS